MEVNGRRIWFEATCAEAGEPNKPDSIPEPVYGCAVPEPVEQFALRIRNALDGKQRKFQGYVQSGIVRPDDLAVVAINVDLVDGPGPHICSHFCKSLYSGLGPPAVRFRLFGADGSVVGNSYFRDDAVIKKSKSGGKVGMRPFVDGSLSHVTAVLGSETNMFNCPSCLGSDFILYPNLECRFQWPAHLLNVGKEWRFEKAKGGGWEGFLARS